jgi:hypothetical protein
VSSTGGRSRRARASTRGWSAKFVPPASEAKPGLDVALALIGDPALIFLDEPTNRL